MNAQMMSTAISFANERIHVRMEIAERSAPLWTFTLVPQRIRVSCFTSVGPFSRWRGHGRVAADESRRVAACRFRFSGKESFGDAMPTRTALSPQTLLVEGRHGGLFVGREVNRVPPRSSRNAVSRPARQPEHDVPTRRYPLVTATSDHPKGRSDLGHLHPYYIYMSAWSEC
jgi:hypothetical protein